MGIRRHANTEVSTTASTVTTTVNGRRNAACERFKWRRGNSSTSQLIDRIPHPKGADVFVKAFLHFVKSNLSISLFPIYSASGCEPVMAKGIILLPDVTSLSVNFPSLKYEKNRNLISRTARSRALVLDSLQVHALFLFRNISSINHRFKAAAAGINSLGDVRCWCKNDQ